MILEDLFGNRTMSSDSSIIDIDELVDTRCKEFLFESHHKLLQRAERNAEVKLGMYRGEPVEYCIKERRYDRAPSDSSLEFHKAANEFSLREFGWKMRNGVFAVAPKRDNMLDSYDQNYGRTYRFFVIGSFEFVWSPVVKDFYIAISRDNNYLPYEEKLALIKAQDYRNTDLYEAIKSKNEIMFDCKEYLLVKNIEDYDPNYDKVMVHFYGANWEEKVK